MSETVQLPSASDPVDRPPRKHLLGPRLDFLTLGGGSLVVIAAVAALYPRTVEARLALAAATLFLAHFVNHPHFAHSYQIFYRGFLRKAFAPESALRLRYQMAGITVPASIVVFFAVAVAQASAPLLGLAANVMFLTVGWHYARQGYGILMVAAAHSGTRFDAGERRRLLCNTHLAWVTLWLLANNALAARNYWGLTYFMFDTPDALLAALVIAVAVSTALVGRDFLLKWRAERALPVNGLVAYAAAVYVWLPVGLADPLLVLVVPFFHSLQYLAVVWRYQLNVESAGHAPAPALWWTARIPALPVAFARFVVVGGLLGAIGFWWAPEFLDASAAYDRSVFGATAFVFMAWTGINIHHYFLDNVIWRRENPETRRHLF